MRQVGGKGRLEPEIEGRSMRREKLPQDNYPKIRWALRPGYSIALRFFACSISPVSAPPLLTASFAKLPPEAHDRGQA